MSKSLEKIIHSRKLQKLGLITKRKRNFKSSLIKCSKISSVHKVLQVCRGGWQALFPLSRVPDGRSISRGTSLPALSQVGAPRLILRADREWTLTGITAHCLSGEGKSQREGHGCFSGVFSLFHFATCPPASTRRWPWRWLPEETPRSRCEPVVGSRRKGGDWPSHGCHTLC